jgi:hypothetical protein
MLPEGMKRILVLALLLASCASPEGQPEHPLGGTWRGSKTLKLSTTEYSFGSETGYWTAGLRDFRYKKAGGPQERCSYSLTGRTLALSDCRLAGQYTRMP